MREATLKDTETGTVIASEGWYVLNVGAISWTANPSHGTWCSFEPEDRSLPQQVGVGVHVLQPGQPNGRYHEESDQEGFLVLDGECIAIVEGEERRMRQWDFLHSPPGTRHILVGAGDRPCAILMFGARSPDQTTLYPVDPVAARYGASAPHETASSDEAYADCDRTPTRTRAAWPPR